MNAMLELDAHNWVSLINESRVSASWVINSSLSTMFCKQRDELVSYSSDFIKICSVNHTLIFSLDEPEVSSNTYRYDGISNVLAISTTRLTISAETSIVCGCSNAKIHTDNLAKIV
jgi:hypothetical protein